MNKTALRGAPAGEGSRASANIRAEIARAGKNQSEVCAAAEMSRSTWYRRMGKPGQWRIEELRRIAKVLDVPVERIANGGQS